MRAAEWGEPHQPDGPCKFHRPVPAELGDPPPENEDWLRDVASAKGRAFLRAYAEQGTEDAASQASGTSVRWHKYLRSPSSKFYDPAYADAFERRFTEPRPEPKPVRARSRPG